MAPANSSFDELVATTLKNYRRQLADNITGNQVLFFMLKERGFMETRDGGETLVEPLLHGENTTVGSYDGYDVLDTAPQEGISAAEYNWKQIAGSVSINGKEEFQNSSSRERIVSLLEAKIQQLEISMRNEINSQLFSDGTGNGGKDLTGLAAAVENGAAWSTYGGIDSNTFTFWRNTWLDEAGVMTLGSMSNVVNSASRSKVRTDIILTTQAGYEAYEVLARTENTLNVSSTKLGDAGFQNLMFQGIPIVWDEDCTDGDMYFLNSQFLKFVVGRGRDFVVTPFQKPENQDAKVSQILVYAQLIQNNRRHQAVLDGITDA
jgi:hypothetical protein